MNCFAHKKIATYFRNQLRNPLPILLTFIFWMVLYYLLEYESNEREIQYWTRYRSRNISHYLDEYKPPVLLPKRLYTKSFLTVMVHSSPHKLGRRNAIRYGWGKNEIQKALNVTVIFLVGIHNSSTNQYYLEKENEFYDDILQENFVDSYSNLTLKSVAMLRWYVRAKSSTYLFKVDEDLFVNLARIVQILRKVDTGDVLLGRLVKKSPRVISYSHKWYSPKYMYRSNTYPNFLLGGAGYVMSRQVAEKIYETAMRTELFHFEDVFLTGICAAKAKIVPKNGNSFKLTYGLPRDLCELFTLPTIHELRTTFLVRVSAIMESIRPICILLGRLK